MQKQQNDKENESDENSEPSDSEDDFEFDSGERLVLGVPMYTIFVGNPGTGKSTLLNGLAQKVLFKNGMSFGEGMTQTLQMAEIADGKFLGDTPGLFDVSLRKQAAEAIKAAMSKNGLYRLIFVVTLEGGRVRPDDATTIKLVLQSISVKVPFGILINKLEAEAYTLLAAEERFQRQVSTSLLSGVPDQTTTFFHLVKMSSDLYGKKAVVPPPHVIKGTVQWLRTLPFIFVGQEHIRDINIESYDELRQKTALEIDSLKKDAERMEQRFNQMKKEAEISAREKERDIANLKQTMEVIRSDAAADANRRQREIEALKNRGPVYVEVVREVHHHHGGGGGGGCVIA